MWWTPSACKNSCITVAILSHLPFSSNASERDWIPPCRPTGEVQPAWGFMEIPSVSFESILNLIRVFASISFIAWNKTPITFGLTSVSIFINNNPLKSEYKMYRRIDFIIHETFIFQKYVTKGLVDCSNISSDKYIVSSYIDVGDGCWRQNMLVTTLRCWWRF